MQSLVITIVFWKESSFSECEEINDQQEDSNRPGSEAEQRGGPGGVSGGHSS